MPDQNDSHSIRQYKQLVPVLSDTIRELPADPPAFTSGTADVTGTEIATAEGAFPETWDSIKDTITDAFAETHTGIETARPNATTSSTTITGSSPDADTPLVALTAEYYADGRLIILAECRPPTGHYPHKLAFGPREDMTDTRIRALRDLALASAPPIEPTTDDQE